MIKKQIGAFFKSKRKKMSVRVLSELTNIHVGAIVKFENGVSDMGYINMLKIMAVLEIDANDLSFYITMIKQELEVKKNEHTS